MTQPDAGGELAALDHARAVADAVLYEGYLLYPYRASAAKNQSRWQFGVLGPQGAAALGVGEDPHLVSECLIRHSPGATVTVRLRFLQLQARTVEKARTLDSVHGVEEADGSPEFVAVAELRLGRQRWISWDEAIEHELEVATVSLPDAGSRSVHAVNVEGGEDVSALEEGGLPCGRLVQRRWPLVGAVRLDLSPVIGSAGVSHLRVEVENAAALDEPQDKVQAARQSFLGAHLLLSCEHGSFVSMTDAPQDLQAAVAACHQHRSWPVLAGPSGSDNADRFLLASPIILEDHPALAVQSPGALFDSTEIDEILTLRILTMTEEEKSEARATDPRAAQILDRSESLSLDEMARMHGALRNPHGAGDPVSLWSEPREALPTWSTPLDDRPVRDAPTGSTSGSGLPWWNPESDASVDPGVDTVMVAGQAVGRGSLVRLQPNRRADAQDLFFSGQIARVAGVHSDVDGATHVGVVLIDDPAADLHEWYGRFLYFGPDEIQPIGPSETTTKIPEVLRKES